MRVVILGKGDMLINLIKGVLDSKHEIAGVFRYERTIYSPWLMKIRDFFCPSNEVTLIKQYKLHEINCKSANSTSFKKEILRLNADVILVGTWREKLKKEIIDLPVVACINVHPSLLPKYRGPNPYLQNILQRESNSGLTFHLMNEEFDKGAILSQKEIRIYPNDTSKELKERTVYNARIMCAELLNKLAQGLVVPIQQNENEATYFKNIKPEDMMLNFEQETAEEISARIRAFHPWLPCYVTYKNRYYIPNPYKLKILPNSLDGITLKNKTITAKCKCGKALEMKDVKRYGIF